jgi:phenylalanine-4-hydroxylase
MTSEVAIAPHLRQYVVEQDYAAYTARDQAVWRFVVRHGHARLCDTAHPAYGAGFRAAGISTERIPRLTDMHAHLSALGFGVVCVDGFIPPRVFQAFQARGILPVAADVRTAAHLTYTPAPDIIHEAAGHAPFLAQPDYARFLRRIGAVSEEAFEYPRDRALYQAIYALSELKERPDASPDACAQAEACLLALRALPAAVSEATRMARLYWWTVEYGLIGTLDHYRLYGAGLLSSVGEAHAVAAPSVRKRPLSAACVEEDYDITRAQPQLFVAEDFAQLEAVLSEVASTLSHVRGGTHALAEAKASEDRALVRLDTGFGVVGVVTAFDDACVALSGPCAITEGSALWPTPRPRAADYVLPLGALDDGTPLSQLSRGQIAHHTAHGQLRLQTRAGLTITGQLEAVHARSEQARVLVLRGLSITRGGTLLLRDEGSVDLLLGTRVHTATPRLPDGYHPPTQCPAVMVPKPRAVDALERERIALHEELAAVRALPGAGTSPASLGALHHTLHERHAHEWLLRVELLALVARGEAGGALAHTLGAELTLLEEHYGGREPIAMALRALGDEP